MTDRIQIESGENIILKIRKHWFILLRDISGTILIGALPFALLGLLAILGILRQIPPSYASLITFVSSLWLLIVWTAIVVLWTNYYLDVWVVTTRRIFNINQVGLFNRNVATWAMDRVQEMSVKTENIFQAFLGYGAIEIQTAGPTDAYAKMEGIPNPENARTIMLQQVERFRKQGAQPPTGTQQASAMQLEKHAFDLKEAVRDVAEDLRPSVERKHLSFEFITEGGDYAIQGDEGKLRKHVFRSLIDNAIRYTQTGGVRVMISRIDSNISFSVKDTGVGITEEDMTRIFTEGGKGRSASVNPESTGYGLVLAKSIVEAHGGRIWVESGGMNKGSQFFVELPAAELP